MHQLFLAFVSLLLSFGHHPAGVHSTEANTFQASVPTSAIRFPDRRELARSAGGSVYSETSCASCLRMNTSYVAR